MIKKAAIAVFIIALLLCLCSCAFFGFSPEMSLEELSENLRYETLLLQIWGIGDQGCGDMEKTAALLNEQQMVFYVLSYYDEEIQNGGLCQFFINAGYMAPYVSAYLEVLGAQEHKALFDQFVAETQIDGEETSSDVSLDAYEALLKRYPFDQFDEAYYQLPPLRDYLYDYIEANLSAFE